MKEKQPLSELVKNIAKLQDVVMLGIGPMSENFLATSFELAKDEQFPLMFIASRNQIDIKEYGAGYVNGWDQNDFTNFLHQLAVENDFYDYYVCRDHGGPWQRDEERAEHLSLEDALTRAKQSYTADIEAGFDLIMIDPTKDPFVKGKAVPLDFVLKYTVELIEFCENLRQKLHRPTISYEVGTEETNGGLTEIADYDNFLTELIRTLESKNLPKPLYAVGQTGTLVQSTRQAGHFDFANAIALVQMASRHGVYLKEHNGDYMARSSLLLHRPAHVSAVNVAPEFGAVETRALLTLCDVEAEATELGLVDTPSGLKSVLEEQAVLTGRWKKWVDAKYAELSVDELRQMPDLIAEILHIAGHYTLNQQPVKHSLKILYQNLSKLNIDGVAFIHNELRASLKKYIDCFSLSHSLSRIKSL